MEKWIAIANLGETFSHSYDRVRDGQARRDQILEDRYLGERALFWGGDHKLVVTSHLVNPKYMDYVRDVMQYSELENAAPATPSLSLSRDILQDIELQARVVDFCRTADRIQLISYSATNAFLDIAVLLTGMGFPLETPESCGRDTLWLRDYLDSKGGFRDFSSPLNHHFSKFKISEGFWAKDIDEAADMVCSFLVQARSCVCKPNRGEGGAGIAIFKAQDFRGSQNLERRVLEKLESDDYLRFDSVVVEELVDVDRSAAGGSPSIDIYVPPDREKQAQVLAVEAQTLSPEGVFWGVQLGNAVLSSELKEAIIKDSLVIAEKMKQWGYVGPFDIDMVLGRDGHIYPVEANTRRTGASHAIDATNFLFGSDFGNKTTVFAFDHLELKDRGFSFDEIKARLSSLLFPIKGTMTGLLLDVDALIGIGRMGYLIYAQSPEHVRELHAMAFESLRGVLR